MRVCKHGCDITRILIGYVLSDGRFDWLVGNMSVCQESLFQSRINKTAFSFICRIIFEKYFLKAIEDFFAVSSTASRVCITVSNSPNFPSCLDKAM